MALDINDDEKALLLAEYQPLREEVNRTVDRMTANELACCAFVFSILVVLFTTTNSTPIPDWIVVPSASFLAMVVACFGYERSKVFRRHMDQVDNYLAELERVFSDRFGWTNHYRATIGPAHARQRGTRAVLWHVLRFAALMNFGLQCVALFLGSAIE